MTQSLASPLTLPCGVSIPNRFGKSAMTEGLADANDNPTEALIKLYRTWSDGGAGLLMTGNVMIDRRYLERAGNVVLEDDQAMPMLQRWAREGTRGGNQLWMQISHPGRQCPRMVNSQPLAPSEVQLKLLGNFSKPQVMTETDIGDVIQRFTRSALLAKQAGFTGVQIHCAHGYLVNQFLSPLINHRDDQWGGSLENRARLARRIIRSVREAVGPGFPVSAKLNSADFQKGGFSFDDCQTVAGWLAEDGLDLLEISGGSYEQASMFDLDTAEVRESTRQREAYFIEYANKIRKSAQIPLMITGGFRNREIMENAVNSGEVDLIGLARPLCTQPDAAKQLINKSIDTVDLYENGLVMGRGFWGNNSRSSMVKSINAFGQLGFYYWQIIRLSKGLPVEPNLGVLKAFSRHMLNDFRLNQRRKKAVNKM
jgi:2,4-dienoyl-CoA reductase-like NADH-dependent reductase (Old Yellow Enzyme family)